MDFARLLDSSIDLPSRRLAHSELLGAAMGSDGGKDVEGVEDVKGVERLRSWGEHHLQLRRCGC
jgi:hypothetical protein